MRLICVPNLTIFIFTLIFTLSHITFAQDVSINALEKSDLQNIDDTSLFRDVESTMDEEGDDAVRILKSLQDTAADDFLDDDDEDENEDEDEQVINHSSSKDIKQRIQPEEGEIEDDNEIDDEIDDIDVEEEDDGEDDEDDEEEDYDFPADSFPDFRNEETAEFFDHLPQQISNAEKEKLAAEEEEDDDVDNNEEDEEEEEENIVDNMNNEKTTNMNNNMNDIPLPIDTITWHTSDPLEKAIIDDDKFYQDGNMNYSNKYKTSLTEFKLWHGMSILLILAIIYKWFNKKTKSHHILDNNNSSLPWSNRDEKDYLPLHNNSRHFKWEIKTS